MSAPRLNRRLTLEARVETSDGAGGRVAGWETLGTLWAEMRPRTGREAEGESGAVSVAGFRILVRAAPVGHSARPLAGQRFRQGARVFNIESVTEREPDGLYLICIAEEETSV